MANESRRIGVLGGGSWGTALAHVAAESGHEVVLWAFEREVVDGINGQRQNPLYLSEITLPSRVRATADIEEVLRDADLLLFAIPSQHVRGYLHQMRSHVRPGVPLVICSKGIERGSLATLDQVFAQELPANCHAGISVLSGPSFALEVARQHPTNVTVACHDAAVAKRIQSVLATRTLRIYTTDDVVGVEIGGAMKNVIAIAVGASDGLGFGDNTRAALMTRGLAEITRLTVSLGGRPETMLGLAGVGDLLLTCTGELSRNRQVGKLLAQGRRAGEIQREMRMVAEGVATAESAHALAEQRGVDCPITEQLYEVLYCDKTVLAAMRALQDRALKDEWQP